MVGRKEKDTQNCLQGGSQVVENAEEPLTSEEIWSIAGIDDGRWQWAWTVIAVRDNHEGISILGNLSLSLSY
jgi:hypothetical protein